VVSSARQALRQRRPFRSVEQEAFLALVRTATALTDALEQVLRTEGLTLAQYNVLRILRGAEPAGLCRNEVRDRMLTRMPDMTRLLDRMEAIGLVVRARTAEDRRLVTTRVTERGLQILERLDDAVTAEHRRRFAHLNKEQIRSLTGLLERVRDAAV
jgi:DNA-binding MarR family transcriptional regulator